MLTLGLVALVVGIFYCLEFSFSSLLPRTKFPSKERRVEFSSRCIELFGSFLVITSGIYISLEYVLESVNTMYGEVPGVRDQLIFMLGFFIYHFLRVLSIPQYMRSLLVHHGLLALTIIYSLTTEMFYFYPAVISLQSIAAMLRNYIWLQRRFLSVPKISKSLSRQIYIFIENVLPLTYLTYFLGWGQFEGEIPWHGWAIGFSITFALLCLTFYWTIQFLKDGRRKQVSISPASPLNLTRQRRAKGKIEAEKIAR